MTDSLTMIRRLLCAVRVGLPYVDHCSHGPDAEHAMAARTEMGAAIALTNAELRYPVQRETLAGDDEDRQCDDLDALCEAIQAVIAMGKRLPSLHRMDDAGTTIDTTLAALKTHAELVNGMIGVIRRRGAGRQAAE